VSEPVFLTVALVERLHQLSIQRFGGSAGVRDRELFESAIVQPLNAYHYGGGDSYDIAAAYAFHIA
jgi:death-on-curing protein